MKQKLPRLARLLLLAPLLVFFLYLTSITYIYTNALTNNPRPSDAILVLGSRTRSDQNGRLAYNPCLYARVKKGVELYRSNHAQKIIVSGGYNPDDHYVEAVEMKQIAKELGVPEEDVLTEEKSTSTYENLLYSKTILSREDLNSIILVSEPYHLPRASLVARKLQIPFTVAPASDSPCWQTLGSLNFYLFRDAAALLLYFFEGRL